MKISYGVETDLVDVLMQLSRGRRGEEDVAITKAFECKTCGRRFDSFQALGGHTASHKKPKLSANDEAAVSKWKVHDCSICGQEFATGQALGGHMRRHRPAGSAGLVDCTHGFVEKKLPANGKRVFLDLNFPPLEEEDADSKKLVLGLGLVC